MPVECKQTVRAGYEDNAKIAEKILQGNKAVDIFLILCIEDEDITAAQLHGVRCLQFRAAGENKEVLERGDCIEQREASSAAGFVVAVVTAS